jgi:methionyl-tRNA formyltransferase
MINNNSFYIKNLKNVVFFGFHEKLSELIDINKKMGIKTEIITSSDQAKLIPKKIDYKVFDNINEEFKKYLQKKKIDVENTLFFSIAARYIFKEETISDLFKFNLINLHESRLPFDAGGAVYSWNILREDRICCLTVHLIDEGIDSGPIIIREKFLYPPSCRTPIDLKRFSDQKFIGLYKKLIKILGKGYNLSLQIQSGGVGRYNPRLNTLQDGWIDWNMEPYDLINFINAFDDPYVGASTFVNNKKFERLFIKKAQLHGGESSNHPIMQGLISRHDTEWIVVCTKGKQMIIIEAVLDQRKKNIISELKAGDRFFTPSIKIEKAKSQRVFYSSKGKK